MNWRRMENPTGIAPNEEKNLKIQNNAELILITTWSIN